MKSDIVRLRKMDANEALRLGFGRFGRCRLENAGETVVFRFSNGKEYSVLATALPKWFSARGSGIKPAAGPVRALSVRRDIKGGCDFVSVRMSDGRSFCIGWETVLRFRERTYEWYGGFIPNLLPLARKGDGEAAWALFMVYGSFGNPYSVRQSRHWLLAASRAGWPAAIRELRAEGKHVKDRSIALVRS